MLHSLFPKAHLRFLSLPLLGPIADSFDDWLAANGYTRSSREYFVSKLRHTDADLRSRQVKEVADLTHPVLHGCWRTLSKTYPGHAKTVRILERYLAANGLIIRDRPATGTSPASILIEEYLNYLREVRGFASSTVSNHRYTAQCLLEQLPRALPWETVRTLLRSIDKTSAKGLRDYAMFLLIATYGLRTSEVVAITLDDIRWRQDSLRIHQPKTSSLLELPLINEVSSAIVKHLKRTPPPPRYRRIFLRMRAPIGVLKRTAVGEAFQSLVRKSGLRIPFQGPHCMRHSLAVHLLKSGTPLKTIGDILGHS